MKTLSALATSCLQGHYRSRIAALLLLTPLVALTSALVTGIPVSGEKYQGYESPNGNSFQWQVRRWGESVDYRFDSETGEVSKRLPGREIRHLSRLNSDGQMLAVESSPDWKSFHLRAYGKAGNVLRQQQIELPISGCFTGERWLATLVRRKRPTRSSKLLIYDLQSFDCQTLPVDIDSQILPIHAADRLAVFSPSTVEGARVDLLKVADDPVMKIASWTLEGKLFGATGTGADLRFYSKPPADRASSPSTVEVRDRQGNLQETFTFPSEFTWAKRSQSWAFDTVSDNYRWEPLLLVNKQPMFSRSGQSNPPLKYFDLVTGRELDVPVDMVVISKPRPGLDGEFLPTLFAGSYDQSHDRFVAPFQLLAYERTEPPTKKFVDSPLPFYRLIDTGQERVVGWSKSYGISAIGFARDASSVVAIHTPFAWGAIAMPLAVTGFVMWIAVWFRASLRDRGWACGDCVVVGGLFASALVLRTQATTAQPLMYVYCQAVMVGGLQVAACWLALGCSRLSLRYIPFFLAWAIIGLLTMKMAESPKLATLSLYATLTPPLLALGVGFVLRLAGIRLTGRKGSGESRDPARLLVCDLFIAIFVLAVVFGSLRDAKYLMAYLPSIRPEFLLVLSCVATTTLVMCLALCKSRLLFRSSAVVLALLAIPLVACPLYRFVHGEYFFDSSGYRFLYRYDDDDMRSLYATLALAACTTFVLLLPYRLRG